MDKLVILFDKTLQEFLIEYNHSFKAAAQYKVSDKKDVLLFDTQITNNIELFEKQDDSIFSRVLILYKIGLHTKKINKKNRSNVWEYIKNLYLISRKMNLNKEDSNKELEKIASKSFKESEEINLNDMKKLTDSLFGSDNPELTNLIDSVSQKLTKKLEGKDLSSINIMELMTDLQNPGSGSDSLGLSSIISELAEDTKKKVHEGDLDINKLKSSIMSSKDKISSLTDIVPGLDMNKLFQEKK